MCGQTAERFDVAEVGATVLLNEFAFSRSHFVRVAMMPPRWRQQGFLRKGVDVTYQFSLDKKGIGNVACTEVPH